MEFQVGVFFENQIRIPDDEFDTIEEAYAWAKEYADRVAAVNEIVVTEVVVMEVEDD